MADLPWQDGHYKCTNMYDDMILVKGNAANMLGMDPPPVLTAGEFGEAVDEVAEVTGKKQYNVEFTIHWGSEMKEYGVVSEDGKKMTFKSMVGVGWMEWITEEEAAAIEAAKDPMDAMSHPYKEQPENLGKFLWITGAPGLGKSTTAQLLARNAGYVYYEADCFYSFRNPYIPPDVKQPSLAQMHQKSLRGEGLTERKEVLNTGNSAYEKMMNDEEYDEEALANYYLVLCDDIKRERERIGGDWAVAMVIDTRRWRDVVRSRLGPDLTFVVLDMSWEDQVERVRGRHGEDENALTLASAIYAKCEPAGDDEPNTVGVKLVPGDTPQQVVEKILDRV